MVVAERQASTNALRFNDKALQRRCAPSMAVEHTTQKIYISKIDTVMATRQCVKRELTKNEDQVS